MISRFIKWIIGLFINTKIRPEIDKKIEDRKDRIKKLDKELGYEHTTVEDARKEWEQ